MSLSLHSLSSQKKGAAFSFVLLAAVALLVVGIFSVSGAKFTTTPAQTFTPLWIQGSAANATINVTVTNAADSPAAIAQVDISKPTGVGNIECGALLPSGWACSRISASKVRFDGSTIAAGSNAPFQINITPPAGPDNYTFTMDTAQAAGAGVNSSFLNVSVDANPPKVDLINISTSVRNLTVTDSFINAFLNNASGGVNVVVQVTDNASGVGNVTLTYNYTLLQDQTPVPHPNRRFAAATGNISIPMFNSTASPSLFNATIPTVGFTNGTRVVFSILANDTAGTGNGNVSNQTLTYGYNFTIDAVAPQFVDVLIANQSLNASTAQAINITSVLTSNVEYIINSSLVLNVSVLVRDDGGAGTVKLEVMDRTGAFLNMNLLTGSNGSAGSTTWNLSTSNISDLVKGFGGDGLYNITFRATDNVSNVNNTYNFTVQVDDTPPTVSVVSNVSIGASAVLSVGNATLSNTSLNSTAFVLRVITADDINNNTANVSVVGNLGNQFNLTRESGTPSGTSVWNITIKNETNTINLSQFCNLAGDSSTCNFKFSVSDVMGRTNSSVNLTIAVDGLGPNVSILTPVSVTTNYSTTVLINASVNDSVGPLQNVSFRWRNSTAPNDDTEGGNVSNWIPMTLNSGSNNQFSAQGYWNATLTISSLIDGNFSIEVNATDSAGRQNTTTNVTNVIFDSSIPTNITLTNPAGNTFWNAMFNISVNATETVSGLRNVSFRLENGSSNWPWVEGTQLVSALATGQRFNASNWNLTHFGRLPTNATNGNFTLRLNVTDTAGNQNTSVTINFTIDTTMPAVSMVFPGNNQNQSANFTVNITVTESNNNVIAYRWENATYVSVTSEGGNASDWINMNNAGGANNWNATFNITEGTPADGNYTIKINVTDKAGNSNVSVYLQLLLDQSRPEVAYVGSLANSQQINDFVINMTTRDNRSFTNIMGMFNISNINATAVRLENSTASYPYFNISFPSTNLGRSDSNRTNVTFEFTSLANGNYNIRFWVNDTAGNQNNTVVVSNITLDNVAPGVAVSITNVSPAISGGVGASGTISFNATVSDNLPLNISITNQTTVTTQASSATYGVFYRFENATHTLNWTAMSTPSFFNTVHNNTGVEHKAVFNTSNVTTTLADGDYTIRINATDKAGNQNTTQTISITIQNSGTVLQATNETFQGGIFNGFANSSSDTYTFLVNTTANATCLYSLDNSRTNYNAFGAQSTSNTMSNNVSREHLISFGPFRDVAASGHTLYYECKGVGTNYSGPGGADWVTQFPFGVDTRSRYNVTVPGKTDNKWPNYLQAASGGFANGWSSFTLATLALSDTTLNSTVGGYNVTNVLASLLQGTATGNFTKIYAYNASTDTWQSFRVGQTGNSFINFSDESEYWINVTQIERIEVR